MYLKVSNFYLISKRKRKHQHYQASIVVQERDQNEELTYQFLAKKKWVPPVVQCSPGYEILRLTQLGTQFHHPLQLVLEVLPDLTGDFLQAGAGSPKADVKHS